MDLRALDLIEIAVSDDGPGVPPDLRQSIFEPGASTQGSSGLGLGIARGSPDPWEATSFSAVMSSCCAFPVPGHPTLLLARAAAASQEIAGFGRRS